MAVPTNWSMVRVYGQLTDDDNDPLAGYTLETVSSAPRLQDTVSNRVMVPEKNVITPGADGSFYWDQLSDTDTDVKPTGRQTKVELRNGGAVVQTWYVSVDHTKAVSTRFDGDGKVVATGGTQLDAIKLTSLEDFSSAPIVGGQSISAAIADLRAESDPFSQYATNDEVATIASQVASGRTDEQVRELARDSVGAALRVTGGGSALIDDDNDRITLDVGLPDATQSARTTALANPLDLLDKTNPYRTVVNQPLPEALPGRAAAFRQETVGLTLTAATPAGGSQDVIVLGDGSTVTSLSPALPGETVGLRCTHAGRWRTTNIVKPQSALDARYIPPRVVAFDRFPGADPTGAAASDAALDAAIALGTEASPVVIQLRGGDVYKLVSAHAINPAVATIVAVGGRAVLDCSAATITGPIFTVGRASASYTPRVALANVSMLGPLASDTTTDAVQLGTNSQFANFLRFDGVRLYGFRDQWILGNNCFLNCWLNCVHEKARRYCIYSPVVANANENQLFLNCTFTDTRGVTVYSAFQGSTLHFHSCSFDYSEQDFEIHAGFCLLTDCYMESRDNVVSAATERVRLVPDNSSGQPAFKMKGGSIWPFWSGAGTISTFLRIAGDTSAVRANAVVSLDGTVIRTDTAATQRYLIRDDRTPYAVASGDSPVDRFSLVNVRDLTYKDVGGAYGVYHPLVYRDIDGREFQLDGGIDHGQVGSAKGTPAAINHPSPTIAESMPRLRAANRLAPTSGDLLLVRLPRTGPGWRASAWDFLLALGTQGASVTYARLGLYATPRNFDPTNAVATLLSSQGFAANTASNVLIAATATGTLAFGDRNRDFYAAVLVTASTMPQMYGRSIDTATNPLLDPQSTAFPRIAGKLTAQTALPATVDLSTLVNNSFVPWLGLRPTAYA